ncbi:uncharacterized protein SOCE26_004900 [Sorangium cellulosum]|uniref:Uncharacterized protein n=1 Tax=Sorangium cellulosum TaxID=56 RepID=A0A2L0EIJ3_SORCE|nr:DUF5615 family PIN-like protein [Sorangium cellulosum]AUX39108.1 uncharacterized protein SOCE26_004900 [Sorangium cellulosum]
MKVLLDTCVAPRAATLLRSLGHDVEHVGDWPEDEVLARFGDER